MARIHDDITKENFELELKALMDKLDKHINTTSENVRIKSGTNRQGKNIGEVNQLKLYEYKLKELYLIIPDFSEEQWIAEKEKHLDLLREAQDIIE